MYHSSLHGLYYIVTQSAALVACPVWCEWGCTFFSSLCCSEC